MKNFLSKFRLYSWLFWRNQYMNLAQDCDHLKKECIRITIVNQTALRENEELKQFRREALKTHRKN